jgi:formate/nitrite transporter FocA (FNT family)
MADEETRLDGLLPPAMARRAEEAGVRKVATPPVSLFALAVLAGAFIALGGVFATTALAGTGSAQWGPARVLAGLAFSLGLIRGSPAAPSFHRQQLVVMAWASRRVTAAPSWPAIKATRVLRRRGGHGAARVPERRLPVGDGAWGVTALAIAVAKMRLGFGQAIALGVLCNALVCLAVWLSYSARSSTDRVLVVVPPISAFVAAGFEHSIANMYFVPLALLIRDLDPAFGQGPHVESLTLGSFVIWNLVPVTAGNLIGGTLLVAAVYWFVYLRRPVPG